MKKMFTNPIQTIGFLAILSIIGLIAIGVLALVSTIKDGVIVNRIIEILGAILYTAIGAKSGLAQYKSSSEEVEQNNNKK